MKTRLLLLVAAFAWLPVPSFALPVLHVDGSGQLTGASGVDVGGVLYDVSLIEGSCATLFLGCDEASDFTFSTPTAALQASQALLAQVLVDGAQGNFGSDPSLIFGCAFFTQCFLNTPYAVSGSSVTVHSAYITTTTSGSQINSVLTTWNTQVNPQQVYTGWTPSAAPVPEPSSASLLAIGLVGLAIRRRRLR